jgi:PHD-finger
MILCDRCERCFHPECLEAKKMKPRPGPWICKQCKGEVVIGGVTDITFDFGVMDYLFSGTLPHVGEEVDRIKAVAKDYRAFGNEL